MEGIIYNYLQYLRDISRKIVSRSGFEQVLLDKSRNNPSFAFYLSEPIKNLELFTDSDRILEDAKRHLERNPDKQMFAGFGFICGQREGRTYAGPILYSECEVNNFNGKSYVIDIDYSTITLNYDLISALSGSINVADDEEYDGAYFKETSLIDHIEDQIDDVFGKYDEMKIYLRILKEKNETDAHSSKERIQKRIFDFSIELSSRIHLQLKTNLERLQNIEIGEDFSQNEEIKRRKSGKSIYNKELRFFSKCFLFVNQIPDQLSTYIALNKLSKEIEVHQMQNVVLQKVLLNSLADGSEEIGRTEFGDLVQTVEEKLPLILSNSQKVAIKNAFESELSYIQGPPGTGKSYTIAAMFLLAAFLDKKVLLISQKEPALRIVKDKTESFLTSENDNICGVIYYDLDARKNIIDQLAELRNLANSPIWLQSEHERLCQIVQESSKELDNINQELRVKRKALMETLEAELNYKKELKNFHIYKESQFEKHYHPVNEKHKYTHIKKYDKLDEIVKNLEKFNHLRGNNLAISLLKKKIQSFIWEYFYVEKDYLLSDFPGYSLSIIMINRLFSTAMDAKSRIKRSCNVLRGEIDLLESKKNELQIEIVKLSYKIRIYSFLLQADYLKELNNFISMLNPKLNKAALIDARMEEIDFKKITDLIPFWAAEIRHLGRLFPMSADIFDLVVVDEASQVNLAEVLPALYRGRSICIVGDHQQLNIKSTGIGFQFSKRFDVLTWGKYMKSLSYSFGKDRSLTVSESSILDFIRSKYNRIQPPEIMLDEHFRSMPRLARFTNDFYKSSMGSRSSDGFKIMTETGDKVNRRVFSAIKVEGKRNESKCITEEAEKVLEIIDSLTKQSTSLFANEYINLIGDLRDRDFSIGVISMIRNQCTLIKTLVEDKMNPLIIEKYQIFVGTPEEYQGNERDIMIFSLGVDENSSKGVAFYQNAQRINVATSRAKYFTFFVYSFIPKNFHKIFRYLKFFNINVQIDDSKEATEKLPEDNSTWTFDKSAYESEFEKYVSSYLLRYIESKSDQIKLFNQVVSCGQKRLDFVLLNESNRKTVAVEVDGISHYLDNQYGKMYSEEHLERMAILKRAGWNIINVPYYKWYDNGWLCDDSNKVFQNEIKRIYNELDGFLLD
ncbi:MAG: AAA domain-containing protein [Ignavibacteriaceae bacterium]|nr:AAA domain-containing protein [Ignavibacteriaceae bacterium]